MTFETIDEECPACDGQGVYPLGGAVCKKCGGDGKKKVAPARERAQTSPRERPGFFRGARIR